MAQYLSRPMVDMFQMEAVQQRMSMESHNSQQCFPSGQSPRSANSTAPGSTFTSPSLPLGEQVEVEGDEGGEADVGEGEVADEEVGDRLEAAVELEDEEDEDVRGQRPGHQQRQGAACPSSFLP